MAAVETVSAETLLKSAYEVAREQRLARNRKVMEELGLASATPCELQPRASPIGDEIADAQTIKPEPKPKIQKSKRPKQEPSRRSKRVQGLTPEGAPLEDENEDDEMVEEDQDETDEMLRMARKIERLKELHEQNRTTYKNPTATYEHTWMRVRTMTDKALERRISVIEKACGEHCIVKMRMFTEVLLLANKDDLAKKAHAALDRLLTLTRSNR